MEPSPPKKGISPEAENKKKTDYENQQFKAHRGLNGKKRARIGEDVYRLSKAAQSFKEKPRLYRATQSFKEKLRLYRATQSYKEKTRLHNKQYYQKTKHLRKTRRRQKKSEREIRVEASSQDIVRGPSSKPILFTAPHRIWKKLRHLACPLVDLQAPLDKSA